MTSAFDLHVNPFSPSSASRYDQDNLLYWRTKSEEIMGASSFAVKQQARRAGQFVCRILLLDSDRNHSDNTVISLQQMGHQVRRAYHGVTAFNIAKAFVPDIMLIDMTRPASGLAVATAMRETAGERVHLVALTNSAGVEQQAAVRGAGFDAQLVKPVDGEALQQMIEHWCDQIRQRRANAEAAY